MTQAEALRKIEDCMQKFQDRDSVDRVELYNFQSHGLSDANVYELLNTVRKKNPQLDHLCEFSTTQAILIFEPNENRIREAAHRYLSDYSEKEFLEELGSLEKINDIFEGANLSEEEIRAAFRDRDENQQQTIRKASKRRMK